MRYAFINTLVKEAKKNPRIFLLTADLGYTVIEDFAKNFPERFINVGVAEENMVGVAAGLALCGKIPFTYTIATFATMRCYEQIRNDVCLQDANVKIVGVGGGLHYGSAGITHHTPEDIAIMRVLPNMTIICPADPIEAELSIKAAIKHKGPVYLRLGKAGEPTVHQKKPSFKIGKGIVVKKGKNATIIATGGIVYNALQAAEILEKKGFNIEVISMHTIKPLDKQLIFNSAKKTKNLITLEEHSIIGGLGGAVAEILAGTTIRNLSFKQLGIPNGYRQLIGSQKYLQSYFALSPKKVAQSVLKLLKKK